VAAAWAGSQARGVSGRVRVSGRACVSGPAGRGSSEFTYFRRPSCFNGTMGKNRRKLVFSGGAMEKPLKVV
jgi:hypothetical protein